VAGGPAWEGGERRRLDRGGYRAEEAVRRAEGDESGEREGLGWGKGSAKGRGREGGGGGSGSEGFKIIVEHSG